jgi:hypothetical protein
MVAGIDFAVFTLYPIPETLVSVGVEEDEEVFVVKRGDVLVDSGAGFGWRNSTGRGGYFKDVDASELGDLTTGVAVFADGEGDGLRLRGAGPAQVFEEKALEVESAQAIFDLGGIYGHRGYWSVGVWVRVYAPLRERVSGRSETCPTGLVRPRIRVGLSGRESR